jgi:DNA-binding response OmpR family regulator
MPLRRAVLIVEDDHVVRADLSDYLSIDDDLIVDSAGTLSEASAALNNSGRSYATVILDIGMPDGDGRDFCTGLRRRGLNVPIIMLSGSVAEVDIVRGLEAGANDYITKPFRPAELAARLRVQFRTLDDSQGVSVAIGPYTFLPSAKLLHDIAKNRRVRLTNKEVAILKLLYRSDVCPVDRQTLLQEVWGYNTTILTHTLETHIHRLRQKMEANPADPVLLVTESRGYRLNSSFGTQSGQVRWW